jgi:proteic killer suppression protein
MIVSFHDAGTEDLFNGRDTPLARRACPVALWRVAARKLEALDSAAALQDLRSPPGNQLEKLCGDRHGAYSIRINRQYRVCFVWTPRGPTMVEVCDYH